MSLCLDREPLTLRVCDTSLAIDDLYKVSTLKEVFNNISCETVLHFLIRYDFYISDFIEL